MIILTLGGGLGNQMFQYAFARKVEEVTNDHFLKFTGYHLVNTVNSEKMLFNLNIHSGIEFCNEEEQRTTELVQERLLKKIRISRKISKICPKVTQNYIKFLSKRGFYTDCYMYEEQQHIFNENPVKYVEGGFQTYHYWENMIPQLQKELKVKTAPSEDNKRMIEEMQSCESVCVHVRRGDYLDPEYAHLNICDEAYYQKAMKRILEQKPNAVFYIFSNNHKEIVWIREHYRLNGYNVRYVDLDNPDYEELRLMYSCKNFIISNSTYSWWGQFLSDNEDKIVIAPSVWNRQVSTDGIYMPNWQLIEVG